MTRSQFEEKPMKIVSVIAVLLFSPALYAGKADVEKVKVFCPIPESCTFNVTVRHADTGWKHYANQWDVVAPDGTVLGTRVLYHPHVDEQPFTRSLSNVQIPAGVSKVTVRARDLVHGWGGKEMVVELPKH
jgi:hypothetical protein